MVRYNVELSSTAFKALKRMPSNEVRRVIKVIESFEEDPFPHGYVKLAGIDRMYRIRVGDYRIIYEVNNNVLTVLVLKVGHRRDVYR